MITTPHADAPQLVGHVVAPGVGTLLVHTSPTSHVSLTLNALGSPITVRTAPIKFTPAAAIELVHALRGDLNVFRVGQVQVVRGFEDGATLVLMGTGTRVSIQTHPAVLLGLADVINESVATLTAGV